MSRRSEAETKAAIIAVLDPISTNANHAQYISIIVRHLALSPRQVHCLGRVSCTKVQHGLFFKYLVLTIHPKLWSALLYQPSCDPTGELEVTRSYPKTSTQGCSELPIITSPSRIEGTELPSSLQSTAELPGGLP